jgi:hypothetical protein
MNTENHRVKIVIFIINETQISQKVKERNPPASGRIYSFRTACGTQSVLSAKEIFALCGGRLKALP